MITRYELIPDSEGAGRFRGGLGVRRDWKFPNHSATLTIFSDNRINRAVGAFRRWQCNSVELHSESRRRGAGVAVQSDFDVAPRFRHQLSHSPAAADMDRPWNAISRPFGQM